MKRGKEKKKEKPLCLTKGQLKTIIDEARGAEVCAEAANLIKDIDEEFESKKTKKPKTKKPKKYRWF